MWESGNLAVHFGETDTYMYMYTEMKHKIINTWAT